MYNKELSFKNSQRVKRRKQRLDKQIGKTATF